MILDELHEDHREVQKADLEGLEELLEYGLISYENYEECFDILARKAGCTTT